jgi:GTPase SAR1 family protein
VTDPRLHVTSNGGERGVLLGTVGTGKSTLLTQLIRWWQAENRSGLVAVVDSKPRFRATHSTNGMPLEYREWASGDVIPNSIAIHSPKEAPEAAKLSRALIYQSLTMGGEEVPNYEAGAAELAQWMLRKSGRRQHTLFVVDEYNDLLLGPAGYADRRVTRTIRSGRERYMSVLTASQRPRAIPIHTLTEATNFYVFQLEFEDDVKYLRKHGVPIDIVPTGHNFVFYRRLSGGRRVQDLMRLNVESRAA